MKRFWRRGDTLVEVTIALAILSLTLMGSTRLAIKAFQQSSTARERTAISLSAQQQLEYLRNFRDTHTWSEFTQGSLAGTFKGVLSPHTAACHVGSGCFVMQKTADGYVPVDGSRVDSSVPDSYIEITADGTDPDLIKFTVSWGFKDISGGPDNKNRVVTQLAKLTSPVPTPPVVVGPTPQPCPVNSDVVLVMDISSSMSQPWGAQPTRLAELKIVANQFVDAMGVGAVNHLALVSFNKFSTNLVPNFSSSTATLHTRINSLLNSVATGTYYQPAMAMARDILINQGRAGAKKIMVFVSDGEPNDYDLDNDPVANADAIAMASGLKSGTPPITMYTIGINPNLGDDNPVLQAMAGYAPGTYYSAVNTADIEAAAATIAAGAVCH